MRLAIVFVLVLFSSALRAQTDSAARLLDDPGVPTDDLEQVFDYLENAPTQFDDGARYHIRSLVVDDEYAHDEKGATAFSGAPEAFRNSLWLKSSRIVAALALQKKAWEPSFADRVTGYLRLKSPVPISNRIRLDQAAIGNYTMGFGSGLLFGDLGKTNRREHASVLPVERGLRGSLSGDPFFAQFGGAATVRVGDHISATGFYSNRTIDARVSGDSISTLYEFADHRTDAELAMKNAAKLSIAGARLTAFNSDSAETSIAASVSAYHGGYDHYYFGTLSHPFFGKTFDAVSIDASLMTDKVRVQSEVALTSNDTMRRTMYVIEGSYRASNTVGVAAAVRHIPFGIVSPFGQFLGKSLSLLTNQDGYYLGVDATIISNLLRASAYGDLSSEILPIGEAFARQKYDYQLALHSTLERWNAHLTIRNQRGENVINMDDSSLAALSTQTLKTTTTRFDIQDSLSKSLIVMARVQNIFASNDSAHSESGWLGKIACKYEFASKPLTATVAAARFSTPSYRSAIWQYEQSAQGAGRFLALYGNGYYFTVSMQLHLKWMNFTVAISDVSYDAPRTIGSGLTERIGDSSEQIVAQLDLLF